VLERAAEGSAALSICKIFYTPMSPEAGSNRPAGRRPCSGNRVAPARGRRPRRARRAGFDPPRAPSLHARRRYGLRQCSELEWRRSSPAFSAGPALRSLRAGADSMPAAPADSSIAPRTATVRSKRSVVVESRTPVLGLLVDFKLAPSSPKPLKMRQDTKSSSR
jgi:hypothetical protein